MSGNLEIKNIRCGYDGETVVDDFSLNFRDTTLNCLLGPSGCGKTTVLRAIAGFESISSGEIALDGKIISSKNLLCRLSKGVLVWFFRIMPCSHI